MSLRRLFNLIVIILVLLLFLSFVFVSYQIYSNIKKSSDSNLLSKDTGSGSQIIESNELEDWDLYINYDYKYLFHYPSDITIQNINLQQFITDSQKYNGIHSDNICVRLEYGLAWAEIYVNPKDPSIVKFCGKYEYKSDQEIIRKQIQIEGNSITVQSIGNYTVNDSLPLELNFFTLENGEIELKVEYGKSKNNKSNELGVDSYEKDKKLIEKVLESIELI